MTAAIGFPMPKSIVVDDASSTENYAKFIAAPFQSGFGHTLGNSLRRVLLSSLEGAAICSVRIDGAKHEFDALDNVVEDVTEIVLNLKCVRLNLHAEGPKTLEIRKDKAGKVTAADIVCDSTVEVLNPDQVICTLDKSLPFRAEIEVISGKGYLPAEKNTAPRADRHDSGRLSVQPGDPGQLPGRRGPRRRRDRDGQPRTGDLDRRSDHAAGGA